MRRKSRGLLELGVTAAIAGIALVVAFRFVAGTLNVDDWIQVEGRFVDGHVEKEVIWDSEGQTVTGDYVVSVVYEYVDPFDRQTKRADHVLVGGKVSFLRGAIERRIPLALPRRRAEALVDELRAQGAFPVYINPQDPSDTGIVRMQDLADVRSGPRLWIMLGLWASLICAAILGTVYVVTLRPDLIDALVERIQR